MNSNAQKSTSKFLSLVLRHRPDKIGITLDGSGWVGVADLLSALAKHGHALSAEALREIVATSDKKRFAFSDDGQRIRANQGHSVEVDLGYSPAQPPAVLYHGTVEKFLAPIRQKGLIKGNRHHAHLSRDIETAKIVAQRRGAPVILAIDSAAMHRAGLLFYVSENGVWLTDHVPVQFIQFPEAG